MRIKGKVIHGCSAVKKRAAIKALEFIEDGMRLGIGSGSTVNEFIRLLGERVADGLCVTGVATSRYSEQLCHKFGVPVRTLEQIPELDLDIDGADEIGPEMMLIKGGGALLYEKLLHRHLVQCLSLLMKQRWSKALVLLHYRLK